MRLYDNRHYTGQTLCHKVAEGVTTTGDANEKRPCEVNRTACG